MALLPIAASAGEVACISSGTSLPAERLWAGSPPGMESWGGRLDQPVAESATPDGNNLFNVTDPTLEAFLPDPRCATGAAVLVVPGGGFRLVAINHEGRDVARWLAARGVAAFVLKYRVVQYAEPSLTQPVRRQLPLDVISQAAMTDARRAMELLRSRSGEFAIDPSRIGAIGFSAGGHVVSMLGLDPDQARRPAFVGNIYGALFLDQLPEIPPANLPPPPGSAEEPWLRPPPTPAPGALPPFFLAMAQDDRSVALGFRQFFDHLWDAGYRPETHLYLKGGHGFGMKRQGLTSDHFIEQYYSWMGALGLLRQTADAGGDAGEAGQE